MAMIDQDDSPYAMKDLKGQAVGIDIGLAKDIAKDLGVELQILRSAATHDEVVEQVFQGKADIGISELSITLARAEKINYSNPYVLVKKAVLLNRGHFFHLRKNAEESLLSFLTGDHKLGVRKGSSYVGFAKFQFPQAKIAEYPTKRDLMDALDKGLIAGVLWDEFELESALLSLREGPLRYIAVVMDIPPDQVAMILPKDDLNFLRWINAFLELNRETLYINDLLKMYFTHLKQIKVDV